MSPRIVVCDDEIHITRAIQLKLSKAGYDVEIACDGLAGWEAVQRLRPALVISDFQMPRLDGLSLCRKLRAAAETVDLPFVLLTAKGFELDEAALKAELRLAELVCKPFSPRELLQLVERTLSASVGAAV
jgi:DNA-binding response OmpR family regulator